MIVQIKKIMETVRIIVKMVLFLVSNLLQVVLKKIKNEKDDNICCYYMERQNNETYFDYSCIEINKYEIENFNSIAFNQEFLDNNLL